MTALSLPPLHFTQAGSQGLLACCLLLTAARSAKCFIATTQPRQVTLTMAEPSTQPRVYFQSPGKEGEPQTQRKLGKFTVRYDRKDLQRRLDIEEWLDFQLHQLYGCEVSECSPVSRLGSGPAGLSIPKGCSSLTAASVNPVRPRRWRTQLHIDSRLH